MLTRWPAPLICLQLACPLARVLSHFRWARLRQLALALDRVACQLVPWRSWMAAPRRSLALSSPGSSEACCMETTQVLAWRNSTVEPSEGLHFVERSWDSLSCPPRQGDQFWARPGFTFGPTPGSTLAQLWGPLLDPKLTPKSGGQNASQNGDQNDGHQQ